ncbi:MAG: PqqD family protein [Verrucomicrobiales bacterium]|nr:PqqD family protein [Verrucomicrobiales bacterium]
MRRRTVLVQSGTTQLVLFNGETGAYYSLDEVGTMVWGLCDGAHSVSEIVTRLFEEYDASVEILQTDLMELLHEMTQKNLLLVKAA